MKKLSRRKFLQISVAATATVACSGYLVSDYFFDKHKSALSELARKIDQYSGSSIIGEKYLELTPAEQNYETLLQSLSKVVTPMDNVTKAVQSSVIHDFETDQIVSIDGWILSRTEARLHALGYLEKRTLSLGNKPS